MQEGQVDDTSATKLNQQYPHDDPTFAFTLAIRMQSYYVEVVNIMYKRIIKNIFNKMKEDVGMLKPKKHANKVGRLT